MRPRFTWLLAGFALAAPITAVPNEPVPVLEKASSALSWAELRRQGEHAVAVSKMLIAIVIPHLEMRNATVTEAIGQVRQATSAAFPAGVSLEVSVAPTVPMGMPTPMPEPRITLILDKVSLLEACKYIASRAGFRVKIDPDREGIRIEPLIDPIEMMPTAEFHLTAAMMQADLDAMASHPMDHPGGPLPPAPVERTGPKQMLTQDVKIWLSAKGITFPPGSSAVYYPETGKLVIRNTMENLDLTDNLINNLGSEPPVIPNPK